MKKLAIFAFAALLVVAFTVPAAAVENIFGGYWRVRAFTNQNFTGEDETEAMDRTLTDTRTRLYYTAKFNDNFSLINKWEMDADFGDTGYGDIGADGVAVEVKNTYADINFDPIRLQLGVQGATLSRGFLFADDFAGAVVAYGTPKDPMVIPFYWIKAYEGSTRPVKDANDADVDYYILAPWFKVGDAMTIQPYLGWITSDEANVWGNTVGGTVAPLAALEDLDMYIFGADLDVNLGAASLWFTGLYEGGEADLVGGGSIDFAAYLLALGGKMNFGDFDVHGQFVYASGDDDPTDDDFETFYIPKGQSYYWSEIMGYGTFDDQVSANSPADQIGNIWFGNIGVGFKMDKLSIEADLWYAELVEATEEELGFEFDLAANYKLMDNLTLRVVGAYLFADDGTYKGPDDSDVYELGTQLSLSF